MLHYNFTNICFIYYPKLLVSGVKQDVDVGEFLLQDVSLIFLLNAVDLLQLSVFLHQTKYVVVFRLDALPNLLVCVLRLFYLDLEHSGLFIVRPHDDGEIGLCLGEPAQLSLLPRQQSLQIPIFLREILSNNYILKEFFYF